MSKPMEERPRRSVDDLSTEDLDQLKEAHRRLREAVAAYEMFLGKELVPGVDPPILDAQKVSKAQREIEDAEAELWKLRDELMGWRRPSGVPSAVESTDWFSEEDRVYDEIDLRPR